MAHFVCVCQLRWYSAAESLDLGCAHTPSCMSSMSSGLTAFRQAVRSECISCPFPRIQLGGWYNNVSLQAYSICPIASTTLSSRLYFACVPLYSFFCTSGFGNGLFHVIKCFTHNSKYITSIYIVVRTLPRSFVRVYVVVHIMLVFSSMLFVFCVTLPFFCRFVHLC